MASGVSPDLPKFTNSLKNEKSAYLLQHVHNPVNWYPWGDEAIQKAKDENKLIFLSIGYAACHWCHVMSHESFENEETAAIMNEHFINIKVDREELPHIDKLYMQFVLLISGSGGWPLSVWLTPNLSPITGGTYFPPTSRYGMPSFKTVLTTIAEKWKNEGQSLTVTGDAIVEAIRNSVLQKKSDDDEEDEGTTTTVEEKFNQAVKIYKKNIDRIWGGTHGAPKFPEISKLNLMFHLSIQSKDKEILDLVLNTLNRIGNGGIHDHIGGGISRYSVDNNWKVPHFEKMLYDQAQFLMCYSSAYKITNDKKYLKIADRVFQYMIRDLRCKKFGFFSSEDADSYPTKTSTEKIEGAYYVWEYEQIKSLIEENQGKLDEFKDLDVFAVYSYHYDVKVNGNVEPAADPHGHFTGKNILYVTGSIQATADKFSSTPEKIEKLLDTINEILFLKRAEEKPRPQLDRKIICSSNGLALSGICRMASILDAPNREEYLQTARELVDFIRENLYDPEHQKLYRSCYVDDDEKVTKLQKPIYGLLDDYAFLIRGLIEFYIVTMDVNILSWAKELQDIQDNLFWDKNDGGYFYSEINSSNVVVRMKEDHDGAEPSGNSISAHNLVLLGAYYEDMNYKEKFAKLKNFFSKISPLGYVMPQLLSAEINEDSGLHMLVVVGPDNEESRDLLKTVANFYVPSLIIIFLKIDNPTDLTRKSVSKFKMIRNSPTVYVCHNKRCNLPITCKKTLYEDFAQLYLFKKD